MFSPCSEELTRTIILGLRCQSPSPTLVFCPGTIFSHVETTTVRKSPGPYLTFVSASEAMLGLTYIKKRNHNHQISALGSFIVSQLPKYSFPGGQSEHCR